MCNAIRRWNSVLRKPIFASRTSFPFEQSQWLSGHFVFVGKAAFHWMRAHAIFRDRSIGSPRLVLSTTDPDHRRGGMLKGSTMSLFQIFTILLVLTAALGYINHRTFGLPSSIGIMLFARLISLLFLGLQIVRLAGPGRSSQITPSRALSACRTGLRESPVENSAETNVGKRCSLIRSTGYARRRNLPDESTTQNSGLLFQPIRCFKSCYQSLN
jgi:hypothetical protein